MKRCFLLYFISFCFLFSFSTQGFGQPVDSKTTEWGPKDTLIVSSIDYGGEIIPYKELENVYVSTLSPYKLAKVIEKYNRLRNAVYVTYPYARTAAETLNDVNTHLAGIHSKAERRKYIKSREKELKEKFSDPLTNLSVYQGKVLMKLINRQTSNNCYELIKEYKGGLNARMYQTVAFFFGSNLRQDYNLDDANDRQIENFVKQIDASWNYHSFRPGPKIQ